MALRLRRGTNAERQTITPLQGELIYVTDAKKLYIGDGATQGGVLVGPVDTTAFDLVNDTTPQLGGDLDLNGNNITGTGNINIDGTITATGNIGLGDADSDQITVSGLINSDIRPALDSAYNLGSQLRRWQNIYSAGAFINGQIDVESVLVRNNIVGADSSIIYDAATDSINVNLISAPKIYGDLLGSVFADDSSTVLVDAINSEVVGNINTSSLIVSKDSSDQAPGDLAIFNGTNNGGDIPFVEINIAKNTLVEPTSLDPEDNVGGYRINAYANGEYKTVTALLSVLSADANITTNNPKTDAYLVVGNNASSAFYFFQGNGIFKAPTAIKTGAFEDEAARDVAIPSPEAGMIILLTGRDDSTGGATFQGYDGTGWRDLST